jgi:hypothetical protein
MTRPPSLTLLLLGGLLAVAECAPSPPPSRASAAAVAACKARTDAAYNRQNRYLLSTRDTTDTPYSTSGAPGNTSAGLSREYDRETMLDNCLGGSSDLDTGSASDGTAFQGSAARNPGLPGQ